MARNSLWSPLYGAFGLLGVVALLVVLKKEADPQLLAGGLLLATAAPLVALWLGLANQQAAWRDTKDLVGQLQKLTRPDALLARELPELALARGASQRLDTLVRSIELANAIERWKASDTDEERTERAVVIRTRVDEITSMLNGAEPKKSAPQTASAG